jgi:hypothetical protein
MTAGDFTVKSRRTYMKMETLEARIIALESQVENLQTLLDIEEIKKLQRAYGYYLEHWMAKEIVDLFADDPDVVLDFAWYEGTYRGKESIRRYYENRFKPGPEFMHQLMQLCPIIDVAPDGKTAKGRWYGCGAVSTPHGGKVSQVLMNGIYENEYIKENGKWKFKRFNWAMNYMARPGLGWVKPERIAPPDTPFVRDFPEPDEPPINFNPSFPSGYVFPFHYTHPVTGEKTTEEAINSSLNI